MDGIYLIVQCNDLTSCILIISTANDKGSNELLAFSTGFPESKHSWIEMALRGAYPDMAGQQYRIHKAANVLESIQKAHVQNNRDNSKYVWAENKNRAGRETKN